jgi:hypothetical protein
MVERGDTLTGYRRWAAGYDEPRDSLFDADEPVMHQISTGCSGRYPQAHAAGWPGPHRLI